MRLCRFVGFLQAGTGRALRRALGGHWAGTGRALKGRRKSTMITLCSITTFVRALSSGIRPPSNLSGRTRKVGKAKT